MKLLFVTSQVTYSPGNYEILLRELMPEIQKQGWDIAGVASLKTLDFSLVKAMVGLPFMGVTKLAKNLFLNSLDELKGKRESILNELGLRHFSLKTMNSSEVENLIKENDVDLVINLRTRCIYKKNILKAPKLGCINIHHGQLPIYRGTFCDLYALFENRPAGFSIHKMEEKVDAGEIYSVQTVNNGSERDYEKYLKAAEILEIKTLKKFLSDVIENKVLPSGIPNTTNKKIYTKNPTKKLVKLFKKEGLIL